MKKYFNITGLCVPEKHYMVDIRERVAQVRDMVVRGDYFTINRARQYGKTTMLNALAHELKRDYLVLSLDFQALGDEAFTNEYAFSRSFSTVLLNELAYVQETKILDVKELMVLLEKLLQSLTESFNLTDLFISLQAFCKKSPKPIVLMIDEVDSATNNQVFLDFLAQLRKYYLDREKRGAATFQSVILAGVYDVKNMKRKLRPEDMQKTNSPWNIAADFDVDLNFSKKDIELLLCSYVQDCGVKMDVDLMSGLLHEYTGGYPFLVSKLCKLLDETVSRMEAFGDKESVWTKNGFLAAVKMLLSEKNTLFESLIDKVELYPDLKQMLSELLFSGRIIEYHALTPSIDLAMMFGLVKNSDNTVVPANRIFDTLLYNYFLSRQEMEGKEISCAAQYDKNQYVVNGHLDVRRVLEKFVEHFHELYHDQDDTFVEESGRKFFLLYLRPIINGVGNYYIEARTRDLGRTDVIVDYRGEQFVIELKIWRGDQYNKRGEQQLMDYLDSYRQRKGYMLSFCFNKNKKIGVHEITIGDKVLIEAVV